MSQNNRNRDGKNRNGRKNGGGGDGGGRRGPRVNARGEQMEVLFAEQQFGRSTKIIAYLGDGTVIYPGSRRFRPRPGKKYLCDVRFTGQNNKVGLARPVLEYALSPEEWVSDKDLRQVLVAELVFEEQSRGGQKRLIAFDNGQAVFPDRGTEVTVGKPRPYMLRERGTVSFAIALPQEAQTGTGLVKFAEALQEWSVKDLHYIVLKKAQNKAGVAMARSEKDVEIVSEYRNVHDLLEVAKDATAEEITKAFRRKSVAVHPDRVFQSWSRDGKEPPLLVKMNAQFFFEALNEAKERAVEVLERGKGGAKPAAEAPKGAETKGQGDRKRKPRKPKAKVEEAPKAEPTATVKAAVPPEGPKAGPEKVPETVKVEANAETDAAEEAGPVTEEGDPIDGEGKVYGKYTVEEWSALGESVKKFERRYGKRSKASANSGSNADSPSASSGSSRSTRVEPDAGLTWQQQLAALKPQS